MNKLSPLDCEIKGHMQKHRGNIFPGFKRKRKGKKAERKTLRYTPCACDPHLTRRFLSRKRFSPLLFITWSLQIRGMKRSDDLIKPFLPQWFILRNWWQEKIKYGAEFKKNPIHGKSDMISEPKMSWVKHRLGRARHPESLTMELVRWGFFLGSSLPWHPGNWTLRKTKLNPLSPLYPPACSH